MINVRLASQSAVPVSDIKMINIGILLDIIIMHVVLNFGRWSLLVILTYLQGNSDMKKIRIKTESFIN